MYSTDIDGFKSLWNKSLQKLGRIKFNQRIINDLFKVYQRNIDLLLVLIKKMDTYVYSSLMAYKLQSKGNTEINQIS